MGDKMMISRELFFALARYHLAGMDCYEDYIRSELQKKLESDALRQKYSESLKSDASRSAS